MINYLSQRLMLVLLTVIGSGWSVMAQQPYSFCLPEVIQYTRQTYGAYNQNWGIVQHPKTRFMYVANKKGLLEFDGSTWRLHELPRKQIVRSVAVDHEGRIYTGALGEFGYWTPGPTGELAYHSLNPLIHDQSFLNEEIWNILVTPQGILFQSFAFIYRYRQGRVQLLRSPGNVLFVQPVRDRLLVEVIDKGLYELRGDAFTLIDGSEFLGSETVNTLLPLGESDILVGTERAIFRYDGQRFQPFNNQLNAVIQQNRLNRGRQLGPDLYAFGTLLNGVLLTSATGHIRYHINQKNGLQNSTVLALYPDMDGNLWVGLDKGLDLINLHSPIRYFTDTDSNMGTLYGIARHGDYLYLGTNQGVYAKPIRRPDEPFQLLAGTQGQVWDLVVFDGQLLCGHNRGTFRIVGLEARLLSSVTGGWVLHRLARHPDLLIQGTYTKLCLYRKDERGQWVFSHTVGGFSAPVRQLVEDETGAIWVNKAPNQGLQRVRLSADLTQVVASTDFATPEFQQATLNLYRFQHHILVTSVTGLQRFDPATDRFVRDQTPFVQHNPDIQRLFPASDSALFVLRRNGTLAYVPSSDERPRDVPIRTNQWAEESEAMVPLDSTYFAFCRENGIALLPRAELPRLVNTTVRPPLIRSVAAVTNAGVSYTFQGPPPELSFSHRQADLLITFCTPNYTRPINYSYWLENSMDNWSPYAAIHQKEFNNLPPGRYMLHLRSNLSTVEATFTFHLLPPWYWTTWSKILYALVLAGRLRFFYQLHLRRVAIKQNQVRAKLEEQLRHQEEASQRDIILLQKDQLEQGLIQKSAELANSTMSLIQKNELLVQLKDELNQVKSRLNSGVSTTDFQRINYLIDTNISSEQDWQLFEANFNKVHEQFLKHLIEKYPDLSQGDLKLAAYLRMNLSTKEIAQLLNITQRSVELKRYRLRKKMNLDGVINLSEYMIKYRTIV